MANESNILSASIELSLRSLQKGAKEIQDTVDSVNNAADFEQVKNEFSSLANRVVQAANMIQTEMGKITKTIDLSQVAKNLDNLDRNVEKIVNNIDAYMEKMGRSFENTNQVDLSTVEKQLTDLQDSIRKFSEMIQSKDFLTAFKGEDVQKACVALRDYATALKNIANIDMNKLTESLSRIGRDQNGNAIFDLSPVAEQVRDFVDAMDKVTNVDRKINALVGAIGKLKGFDGSVDGSVFQQLARSLDEIASKSIAARDAASGVDIIKELPDEKQLINLTNYIARIYRQFNAISGIKFAKDGSIANPKDIVTFMSISDTLEDIKSNIVSVGDKIAEAVAKGQDASSVTEQVDQALDQTKTKAEQLSDVLSTLKKNALTAAQVKNTKDFSEAMHQAAALIKLVIDRLIAMKTNADQALATTENGAKEVEKAQSKIASNGKSDTSARILGDTSTFESDVAKIVAGLSSVQNGSKKANITIGKDIASIASAIQALTDANNLDQFAAKLKSVTGGDMQGLTDTFNSLKKQIEDVGNAITTMFVGKTVSGVNSANNEVISFISSLEGIKGNMDSFMMADPGNQAAGMANFSKELNKIGTLITRIFTDYESYESAVSNFDVDLHGQAAFVEHLRKLSTETTNATVNADEFRAALQGIGVSESALEKMTTNASAAFSQSMQQMFSTDPAASFVQNTSQYLNKFRDLSQESMSKANGFFTAFKDSGEMKIFASNLQSVAQMISGMNIDKLNELIDALHNLFAANRDAFGESLKSNNAVQLDTTQFEQLTTSIKETTKAIADFVQALAKMTPGQLDNLLENIITIANATGNTTAQAAAQTKQKYDEMKGNLETAKHAIAGMMKGNEATFATYQDEFMNAMTAVDEYINTINNKDGGYHNLKVEAGIIRQFQQLWTDATAAADAYMKKQDDIQAKEREKRIEDDISGKAKEANTRVAQLKAIAGELGKLDSKDGTRFSELVAPLNGLNEAMEKWHRQTARTKETEAIWASYQAAMVKVNSEMNRLNDAVAARVKTEQQAEESQNKASAALAERIKKLREANQLYASMAEATRDAVSGASEYDAKDTVEAGSDDPIQRIITYYQEGVGKVRKVIRQIKDEAGKLFYYIDPESSAANKYNENAYVRDAVKQYQAIFEARAKLASLGEGDTQQRENLQAEIKTAAQLLLTYKQMNPELLALARATEDFAKAKKKAEDAESKRVDKQSAKQNVEDQRNLNALLKRQYEIKKEIQNLEISLGGTKNKNTAESIQNRIAKLKQDEADVTKDINDYAQRGVQNTQLEEQYQRKLTDEKERSLLKDKQSRDVQDQILNRMMSMVRNVIVMRMMRQIWTEAIKYAQAYYDKMNEIQIVTMKSSGEIAQLSAQYKTMAKELKISSTDIATAAVEFWRQGIDTEEVAERTKWTSQYAKITGQSFDQAATLVTASTNSMGVSAQEAVDLFTYLGDASASSGEEIGAAMQKSAAAAAAFGLDFKKLGAYIATVSETTRQEASSIGTAFNTIIARWHSIKKSGYATNDDGTTTASNDITKALRDTVGISLMDAKTGQWRDMGVVLDEIAAKWNGLSAAQRSYIATTMAGTKQQNVFLALMQDMALGAENGSRMYELYAGALDSAGTVAEKYAVYLESVTAAQEGMNVSLQELYDVIMSGDTLKTFYNTMSDLSHLMATGLQTGVAQGTIKFTAMAGAIGTVVFVVMKLKELIAKLMAAKGLSKIMSILTGGKLMLAVGAIAAVVAGVVALAGAYKDAHDEAKKLQELQTKQQEISADYTSLNALKDEYTSLISIANRTEAENARLKQVWENLKGFSPTLAIALANVSGGMENQTGVTEALNGELERLAENYKNVAIASNTLSTSQIMDQHNASLNAIRSSQAMNPYRSDLNMFMLSDAWSYIVEDMNNFAYDSAKTLMTNVLKQDNEKLFSIFDPAVWGDSFQNLDGFIRFAKSNPEIVDNVVQSYVHDLFQTIEQAWSDAEKESGSKIDFSNFIIQAMNNVTDDDAVAQLFQNTAQKLYDNFFNMLRPANWSSMSVGERSIFTDAFEAVFSYDNFGEYSNKIDATPIDYIIGAMLKGEDEVNAMFMRLLFGSLEYVTQSSAWKDEWAKAYSDTVDAFKNDDIDNNAAYSMLLKTYQNLKSKYGDDFFVSMPDVQEFEEIARGVAQIGYSADDASGSVKKLSDKLNAILKEQSSNQRIENLEKFGFEPWLVGLEYRTKWAMTDEEKAKSIYSWMSGLPDDELTKFLDLYPKFTDVFLSISEMGKTGDYTDASNVMIQFGDALDYASDKMLVAADRYKKANDGVTDEEGQNLVLGMSHRLEPEYGGSTLKKMLDGAMETFDSYTVAQQNWVMDNSEGIKQIVQSHEAYVEAAKEYQDALDAGDTTKQAEAQKKMAKALDDSADGIKKVNKEARRLRFEKLEDGQKVFEGFADLVDNAEKGGKDFVASYGNMLDRVDELANAMDALAYIQSGATEDTEMLKNAYSDLSSFCGVSADALRNNLNPALMAIDFEASLASGTISALLDLIWQMNGVSFDPGNAISSLNAIANSSDQTASALANTAIQLLSLSNAGISLGADGKIHVAMPNRGNAYNYTARKGGSGGGGGGGGGSGKDNVKSENTKWIEETDVLLDRISDKMNQLKTIMGSWDEQGYFSAEIDALSQMNGLLAEQSTILQNRIEEAQKKLPALIEAFNKTKPDTTEYDETLSKVNEIQDAIVEWTQQLEENRAEIISNQEQMKELKETVRDMEISLENEVLKAIEEREERINSQLEARIEMEDTILDILMKQEEDAEKRILDSIEEQIEALNKEKDAISEILNARKEQSDAEEKMTKLNQLQAKYARIMADPTRAKEAGKILEEINDLRDEIAWEQAENESNAQQEAIDQKITSLEDYRDYIEEYYDELLENPRNFMDKANEIMKMTQEEILAWLKENGEEYQNATDNTRTELVNGWMETLNTINGVFTSHWDEVNDIISQGEDAVIAFLKQHASDYREASKLQQQAYIDGWKEMFEDIRKAYEKMEADILDTNGFVNKVETGGTASSSGGSGSSKKVKGYKVTVTGNGQTNVFDIKASEHGGATGAKKIADQYVAQLKQQRPDYTIKGPTKYYKQGGIADFTGPAWMDGTKTSPERILSATQTKLFETLVSSLEEMSRIRVAPMRYYGDTAFGTKNYGYTFGDINITVEKLDDDQDIEAMAEKVKESIVESMMRGKPIGGIML